MGVARLDRRWPAVAVFVACAAVVVAGRLRLSAAPLYGDICGYAVIGHEMTAGGRPLYADLWERKPPLLYATFAAAERVAGYGPGEIALVNVAGAVAVLAAVQWAGGPAAAVLWALLSADLDLTANQPDPELFINACLTAAVAMLVRCDGRPAPPGDPGPTRRPAWGRVGTGVTVGVLLAAGTMYKHNAALAAAGVLAGHVAANRRRPAVIRSLVAGGVIALVWATFLARQWVVGRLGPTVDVLFRQNVAYSGGGSFATNLLLALTPGRLFPDFAVGLLAPAVLIGIGAWRSHRPWPLWVGWSIGTWATVGLTAKLYPHYYQLWLPIACVGGGWAAVALWRANAGRFVVVAVLAIVAVRQAAQFTLSPAQWVRRQFGYYSVADQNAAARRLATVLGPGERVWELGSDNALYFFTRTSPPSGLLFVDPLLYGGETAAAWARLRRDLAARPPTIVVVSSDWTKVIDPAKSPVGLWLAAHYRPWRTWVYPGPPGGPPTVYDLLVRRHSRLDAAPLP